jgi:hypothetical protein
MFLGVSGIGESKSGETHKGGRVEATPNFKEFSRGWGDVKVIKNNLKYKNNKSQQ